MAKKLSTKLYTASRKIAKAASKISDAERIVKGDVSGLAKKHARKATYKQTNKIARTISKKLGLK